MAMVGVASGSLQADSQPGSFGLVWGSAAAWRRSVFIMWTGWTLAVALSYDDSTINIVVIIFYFILYKFIFSLLLLLLMSVHRLMDRACWVPVIRKLYMHCRISKPPSHCLSVMVIMTVTWWRENPPVGFPHRSVKSCVWSDGVCSGTATDFYF